MKMKRGAMFATLLAIGSVTAGTAIPAGAAPGPCRGDDRLIADTLHESYDDNGNDLICHHSETGGWKKSGRADRYYDDRI